MARTAPPRPPKAGDRIRFHLSSKLYAEGLRTGVVVSTHESFRDLLYREATRQGLPRRRYVKDWLKQQGSSWAARKTLEAVVPVVRADPPEGSAGPGPEFACAPDHFRVVQGAP